MKYEETYHGNRIVITTTQLSDGSWRGHAEVQAADFEPQPIPLQEDALQGYRTEEDARQAALSEAAGAIDRTRIHRGKP